MRILTQLLVGSFMISIALAPSLSNAGPVTIATFNTEFLTRPKIHLKFGQRFIIEDPSDQKRWNDKKFRDEKFTEAARATAAYIASFQADILALTEVGDERDVRELVNELDKAGVTYPHIALSHQLDPKTFQGVAVLSKLPLGETSPLPGFETYLPEPDDPEQELEAEVLKGLQTSFTVDGQTFYLFLVHLKSERGGNEADERRIAQASIVRRLTLPLLERGQHVIVAGDINDHRGQPTLRRIRGLDDIGPDLLQTGQANFFSRNKRNTRWTYEFQGVREQIDHILLSRSILEACGKKGVRSHVIKKSYPPVSDHRPFLVTLHLKEQLATRNNQPQPNN